MDVNLNHGKMDVDLKPGKDGWDKFKIITGFLIPITIFIFTMIYKDKQHKIANANLELARSNSEIAKVQIKTALLPALSSKDYKQRKMAVNLVRALDESFAIEVAKVLSEKDPDQDVQKTAAINLKTLSQKASGENKKKAEEAWNQYDNNRFQKTYAVRMDLRTKKLFEKLDQAKGYYTGSNISGREKALQLYRTVVNELSLRSRNELNQRILIEAENDYKAGYTDDALRKYHSLFIEYTE